MTEIRMTVDLAQLRAEASRRVDRAAEAERQRWVTAGSGQAMVYIAKAAEARRYLAATPLPADLADYPLLSAELGITAPTALDLAHIWLALDAGWTAAAARIEAARLAAKAAIAAAATPAAISAAQSVDWQAL